MQQNLSIITLGVKELEKSRRFYEEKLGWQAWAGSDEHIVFFQLSGKILGLYPLKPLAEDAGVELSQPDGYKPTALALNLPDEASVDAVFAELKANAVEIVKPPEKVFWGGYRGYFADPDGNLWEVAHNPYFPIDENGNPVLPEATEREE